MSWEGPFLLWILTRLVVSSVCVTTKAEIWGVKPRSQIVAVITHLGFPLFKRYVSFNRSCLVVISYLEKA